jgi:adenylate cyclase
MAIEIERKFLVADASWRGGEAGVPYRQGYLAVGPPASVRVRIAGAKAMLNIKNAMLDISRAEFEYPIPLEDAEALLEGLCDGRVVEKTRYKVPFAGHVWEVDEFCGANAGLVVAEIELKHVDEAFAHPPWLAAEVSGDPRYLNSNLALHPFTEWRAH